MRVAFSFVVTIVMSPILLLPTVVEHTSETKPADKKNRIHIELRETAAGELMLVETVLIAAPVSKVWDAYTTASGYASWAAPIVQVDLRVGGTIRTNYNPKAKIGDPQTNTVHIINYVPEKLLTLQAEISENWPKVLKSQASHLYNVILFEALGDNRTRIVSYGLGYHDNKEMRELMNFFIHSNKTLYTKLIAVLE